MKNSAPSTRYDVLFLRLSPPYSPLCPRPNQRPPDSNLTAKRDQFDNIDGLRYTCGIRTARGVAQSGSAPEWGSGGRWFESSRPDQSVKSEAAYVAWARVRRFCITSIQIS